jgi:CRP/FNR family transcriptional regulator, dissimilatory nitrate respiration regulator
VSASTASELLAGFGLFAPLGERALARVAKAARAIEAPRGTVLYARGDPSLGVHALISGRVKLALPATDGSEKVVALIGRGETFGEPAALIGEPHLVGAETLMPTRLLLIERSALLACMSRDAAFAGGMAAALSRRLRRLMREIENTTLHSGTERVVDFLVRELADSPDRGAAIVELPAKKRIIASCLDLTHEHFSRILHDLAAARLLVVQGPRVSIPDIAKLRAWHGEAYAPAARGRSAAPAQSEPGDGRHS